MEEYPKLTDEARNMKTKPVTLVLGGILAAAMPLAAATEDANGYMWYYRINGDTAENVV